MRRIDCLLIGHYALSVTRQVQLAEMAFGKDSLYYFDALEKTFVPYKGQSYTSSQLYNLFYSNGAGDLSFDHVTFEHSFNTAVANIGTYLVRSGFSIDFVSTFNQGRALLPELLSKNDVLMVAITTTFYVSAFPIAQIVRHVRRYGGGAKVVVGGPFIKNLVATYKDDPAELTRVLCSMGADYYVASNEGEETLARLIDAVKRGDSDLAVPNVYCKRGPDYVFTHAKAEDGDLRRRMVDWSLFMDHIPALVNVRTTKSCPFDCAFCGLPVAGGRWKRVPVEELEIELRTLHESGKRPGIFFIDETLNFPPERFKEILRMMIRGGFSFQWEGELRCNTLDREAVELMAASGCQMAHLGIESGNQAVLDNMQKRVKVDDYRRAMDLLHELGIMTSALILVGFPGETEETFRDTFDFIETHRPTFFRVHRWFYDHDTPIHLKRLEHRLSGGGYHWKHATMDSLTAHELSTELSLSVKGSIHTDDYTMAFYLASRGYPRDKILSFLRSFDLAVKEKCKPRPDERMIEFYVDQTRTALT
jgi:radical SAM PhpK family P-methyltransferase